MLSQYVPQGYISQANTAQRQTKHQGKARNDPVQYEALINTNADMSSDQKNRNQNPEQTWAPYSDNKETYRVQRGEWALARVGGFDKRDARQVDEIGLVISVFSALNGLSKTDCIKAVGIIENPSLGHGTSSVYTNAGSVRWGGKGTAQNTGPETIHTGDRVYLSLQPYTIVQNGQVVPAIDFNPSRIKDENDDGVGIPEDKFYAASVVFNACTALQAFDHLRRDLGNKKQMKKLISSNSASAFRKEVDDVLSKGQLTSDMPLFQAGHLLAVKLAIYHFEFVLTANQQTANLWSVIAECAQIAMNTYLKDVGGLKQRWDRSLHDSVPRETTLKTASLAQVLDTTVTQNGPAHTKAIRQKLCPQIETALQRLEHLQTEWMNRMYVGTALVNAGKGDQIHMALALGKS